MKAVSATYVQLLELTGGDDRAAFAAVYEEHVDHIYRHIYYFVRSRPQAEDLTAQTFLRAWAAISRYQDCGKPILSWLLTIAHNLVIGSFRNGHREGQLHEGIPLPGRATAPEEATIAKSEQDEIMRAVMKLGPAERQVILLRFVDEMAYDEVAGILNKSVNAVRVIQYRALRKLREILSA